MIETPADILAHHAGREAATAFVAWRKALRKPLTERAALMVARTLQAINAAGGDGAEALDMAQEHGWQTIKADWYWGQKDGSRKNRGSRNTDATVDAIHVAAANPRTPRADCF